MKYREFLAVAAREKIDYRPIHQIKQEAFDRSQAMDTAASLTDRHGPRLTASPEFDEAAHPGVDTYDHLVPADPMQASAVIASLVAMEANAPKTMPRKAVRQP